MCIFVIRTWRLTDTGLQLCDRISGAESVTERIVTRVKPEIEKDGIRIAGCRLREASGLLPRISTETFVPRLVCHIGMKDVETLYLLDYEAPAGGFRVEAFFEQTR